MDLALRAPHIQGRVESTRAQPSAVSVARNFPPEVFMCSLCSHWLRCGAANAQSSACLILLRARGCIGPAARGRGAIERHALDAAAKELRLFGGEGARVDAHPGNLGRETSVLNLWAAIHHD